MDYTNFDYGTLEDSILESATTSGDWEFIWAFVAAYLVVIVIVAIVLIVAQCKIFSKAGKPAWAAIIPIYNQYVLFEMVGMKGWYAFLAFIPVAGVAIIGIMSIIAYVKLATCFGKDTGFAVGMILLPVVFLPILAFSSAQYTAPEITTIN